MATEWDGFVEHPAWQKIVNLLSTERVELQERLLQTATVSQDAAVAVLAREILRIDKMLVMPSEERAREQRDADDSPP